MKTFPIADLASKKTAKLMEVIRRFPWIYERLTPRKLQNLARASLAFMRKSEQASPYPPILKVDISPLCNLHCSAAYTPNPVTIRRSNGSTSRRTSE